MTSWDDDVDLEPVSIKLEYPQTTALPLLSTWTPPASNGVAWQNPQPQPQPQPTWPQAPAVKPLEIYEQLPVVRIRGIPFQESEYTILKWLIERAIVPQNGVLSIHFVYNHERQWSGDCFIQLRNDDDYQKALKLDKVTMNSRYLEVFASSPLEMKNVLQQSGLARVSGDFAIRLRGLDYKVTREEIRDFFKGVQIAGGLNGVIISKNEEGRTTGEAYVLFENQGGVEQAVQKHKEKMGHRYVEIYLAGAGHINSMLALGRAAEDHLYGPPRNGSYQQEPPQHHPQPTNGYRDGQQSFRLLMRGLPWHVSEREIEEFFLPIGLKVVTKNMSNSDVFDGSAWVEFHSQTDMEEGLKRDKTNLGHRYIELFTASEVQEKRIPVGKEPSSAYRGGAARSQEDRWGGAPGSFSPRGGGRDGGGPDMPYSAYRDEMNPLPPPTDYPDNRRTSSRGGGTRGGRGDSRGGSRGGGRGASRGGRGDSRGGRGEGSGSRGGPPGRGGSSPRGGRGGPPQRPTPYDRPPQQNRGGDRGQPGPRPAPSSYVGNYRPQSSRLPNMPNNGYAPPPQIPQQPSHGYQPQASPRYVPSVPPAPYRPPPPSYSNMPQPPPGFMPPPGYQQPYQQPPPQQYAQYPF